MDSQSATKSADKGRQATDREAAGPASSREGGGDARPEGNPGIERLARLRATINGGPRGAQLKALARSLNSRAGDPAPALLLGRPNPVADAVQPRDAAGVNDDQGLEREADVMGSRSAAGPAARAPPRRTVAQARALQAAAPSASAATLAGLRTAAPQPVVQRRINIAGEQAANLAAVQDFFARSDVHYYHSYSATLQGFLDDDTARAYGADEVQLLLTHLQAAEQPVNDDEVQIGIQRKLVEASELFRRLDSGEATIPGEYSQWYDEFIGEGLCLGFVRVFQEHPSWLTGMWRALETWAPPHGVSVEDVLDNLNQHIEQHMNFGDEQTGFNFLEAVLLAKEAWENMQGQDPEAEVEQYGEPPELIGAVEGTASGHSTESINDPVDEEWNVGDVEGQDRWVLVRDYIDAQIGELTGTFHIIVWHPGHEMAIRCVVADGAITGRVAVETVGTGMARCDDWVEVGNIIRPRLNEAQGTFAVDIRRQEALAD